MSLFKRNPFRLLLAGLFCSAVLAAVPLTASAETASGDLSGVYWEVSEDGKTLTFSGNGVIPDVGNTPGQYYNYSTDVETIVIGNGITGIGESAFKRSPNSVAFANLSTVTMGNSVTSIGNSAFKDCWKLSSVTFSNSLTTIGNNAFENCFSTISTPVDIVLPDSVTTIGAGAFDYCSGLKNVHFPTNLTSIGNAAFRSCSALTAADLAETKLATIGENAFKNCSALSSLTLPSTLTKIAGEELDTGDAFLGCDNLKAIYCYADPYNIIWNDNNKNDFYDPTDGSSYEKTVCYVPDEYYAKYNEYSQGNGKFSNVNVSFQTLGLGALYGQSLSLEGDIAVNFYMQLPGDILTSNTAYMLFTVPNGSSTEQQQVKITDAVQKTVETDAGKITCHVFKCRISAKDMASNITAQMFNGDLKGLKYTFSIKEYAGKLLAEPNKYFKTEDKQTKGVALVKAMLNYGTAAQMQFGTTSDGLANDITQMTSVDKNAPASVTAQSINKPYTGETNFSDGVKFYGSTLTLKSETTLSFYFTGLGNSTEFICAGHTVDKAKTDTYVIARVRGINAKNLGDDITVTFGDTSVTYNPMTYCYNVLNDDSYKAELKDVCRALFLYWQKAASYFGNSNSNN